MISKYDLVLLSWLSQINWISLDEKLSIEHKKYLQGRLTVAL